MAKTYVDGFVLVIPTKNRAAYKKMAQEGARTWKRFGALDYKECRIDDKKPKHVKMPFAKMVNAKPSDDIWFSYIVFRSKAHRNAVNKKVMAYFDKKYKNSKEIPEMPFDELHYTYAGFMPEVES